MALARARPIYGSTAAQGQLCDLIAGVLRRPRDPETLQIDVLGMRGDMLAAKPPRGPLDVKLMRGGLVDSEFLVHYLQLREGTGFDPAVERAIATLADTGLLPEDYARHHLAITRYLVAVRLFAPDGSEPDPAARPVLARACGEDSYEALLQSLAEARQGIAAQWARHFGQTLEIE